MPQAIVGICTIELDLPEIESIKDKRSIIKPLLLRLHRDFNVSASEVGMNDKLDSALIAIAIVTNNTLHANQVISNALAWVENHYHDVVVVDQEIEIL